MRVGWAEGPIKAKGKLIVQELAQITVYASIHDGLGPPFLRSSMMVEDVPRPRMVLIHIGPVISRDPLS